MPRIPTRKAMLMRSNVNRDLWADRLCERLAFERIVEVLYSRALDLARGDRNLDEIGRRLRGFRREERLHAEMLEVLLRELGRDTRSLTPSAEVAVRELDPLRELASAPGVDFPVVMGALVAAELLDENGWELLVALGREADLDEEWLSSFRAAWREEKEHLHVVRAWDQRQRTKDLFAPTVPGL